MEKVLENGERILVCLSSSPSNQKVIDAAAKMAEAFHAVLTAVYVKPANYDGLPESDK
ncbi:MAG: universal stress protein, partial [Firmicutes bacterium]|nr:universal stress protein [Bacillota bacterium]